MKSELYPGLMLAGVLFLAGAAQAAPIDPKVQFDLICRHRDHEYGRHDPAFPWTAGGPPPTHGAERYVVDLKAMRYCDVVSCRNKNTSKILALRGKTIVFDDSAKLKMSYRMTDGRDSFYHKDEGLVSVNRGHCRKLPFTTFDTDAPPPQH